LKHTIASIALLSALTGCVATPTVVGARPFGYEMGQIIENEPDFMKEGLDVRLITSGLPAPFTHLSLFYTPNAGICEMVAMAYTGDYDAWFSILQHMLTDRYGEPTLETEMRSDLLVRWHDVNVDNIHRILLKIPAGKGLEREEQFVGFGLQFANYDDCLAEANSTERVLKYLDWVQQELEELEQ